MIGKQEKEAGFGLFCIRLGVAETTTEEAIRFALYGAFFTVFSCWGMYYICFKELIEVLFSSITITPTQVVWKCLFKKTCRIALEGCIIGVEKEIAYTNMTYLWLYFSHHAVPREYQNQIQKLPSSDTFIKFRYRKEIAEYLLNNLPKEQTKTVSYYYELEKRKMRKKQK